MQSSSDFSNHSGFTAMGSSLDPFEKLVEGLQLQAFTSIQSLRKRLNDRRNALQKDTTRDQFLAFSNVPQSRVSNLDDDSCRVAKFARLSYNTVTQTLIFKIMPSLAHGFASREFEHCIYDELCAMSLNREIKSLGSTTVQIGDWTKEADECWAPCLQRVPLQAILEIGLSESARQLALDAQGWLESSGSTIQMAITLNIDRSISQITIQRWELLGRDYHIVTPKMPQSAFCVQEVTITRRNNTTNVSGDLTLPFKKFIGRDTNPDNQLERDLVISRPRLKDLAENVWSIQGFM